MATTTPLIGKLTVSAVGPRLKAEAACCLARKMPEVQSACPGASPDADVVFLVVLSACALPAVARSSAGNRIWITEPEGTTASDLAAAHSAGVQVIVTWDDDETTLHRAVLEAAAGRSFVSDRLHLVGSLGPPQFSTSVGDRFDTTTLTTELPPRQLCAVQLAVEGLSNDEIAERMKIANKTVRMHLRAAFKTLGVKRRSQLAGRLHPPSQHGLTGFAVEVAGARKLS